MWKFYGTELKSVTFFVEEYSNFMYLYSILVTVCVWERDVLMVVVEVVDGFISDVQWQQNNITV